MKTSNQLKPDEKPSAGVGADVTGARHYHHRGGGSVVAGGEYVRMNSFPAPEVSKLGVQYFRFYPGS